MVQFAELTITRFGGTYAELDAPSSLKQAMLEKLHPLSARGPSAAQKEASVTDTKPLRFTMESYQEPVKGDLEPVVPVDISVALLLEWISDTPSPLGGVWRLKDIICPANYGTYVHIGTSHEFFTTCGCI